MNKSTKTIVIGGGARSGKSSFAISKALSLGPNRIFLATGQALDDEMAQRIAKHKSDRNKNPGQFHTIEEPITLVSALKGINNADVVLVDCLTLWLSNLLLEGNHEKTIESEVTQLVDFCATKSFHLILVTNEVGLGIVPEHTLSRQFRDIAGLTHQRLAQTADELYFAAMGAIIRLKPNPTESFFPPHLSAE